MFWPHEGSALVPVYLIRTHVMPLTSGVTLTQATVLIPQYILAEVTLSFLGLGVGEPAPSWGNMLAEARQYHALVAHPWLLAPGFAALPVLFAYLILADALVHDDQSYPCDRSAITIEESTPLLSTLVNILDVGNPIH